MIFSTAARNDRIEGRASRHSRAGAGTDTLIGDLGIDWLQAAPAQTDIRWRWQRCSVRRRRQRLFRLQHPAQRHQRDTITDFNHIDDTFQLEARSPRNSAGTLNAAFFRAGVKALDANDYIVYNRANELLSYDVDGMPHAPIALPC